MIVMGVDPGYENSAWVIYDGDRVSEHDISENESLVRVFSNGWPAVDLVVFEQIHMGGMIAGREVFETAYWTGRLFEAVRHCERARLFRQAVKKHLCNAMHAKDANVRQALIDRFGASKERAIGKKHTPGPLFGIKSHEWAALAIAVTWWDQHATLERKDVAV